MFDQTFVNTQAQTRKPYSMAVSLMAQAGVVAGLLIIPLLHPEVLQLHTETPVFIPLHAARDVPAPQKSAVQQPASGAPRPVFHAFTAPTRIPEHVSMVADVPEVADPMISGPVTAIGPGFAGIPGMTGSLPNYAQPGPPPVQAKKPERPKGPTHVSSGVQSALLIFGPKPPYPTLAKAARVQGSVRLQAVIARDGTIQNLQLMSGPPLLVNAALEAVRQWRYKPTMLNGEPVEVITEIDVNFMLSQ